MLDGLGQNTDAAYLICPHNVAAKIRPMHSCTYINAKTGTVRTRVSPLVQQQLQSKCSYTKRLLHACGSLGISLDEAMLMFEFYYSFGSH
jgi:hypothetical protein